MTSETIVVLFYNGLLYIDVYKINVKCFFLFIYTLYFFYSIEIRNGDFLNENCFSDSLSAIEAIDHPTLGVDTFSITLTDEKCLS